MLYGVSIRQGRDLTSYETSDNKFEYLYDENGMRYRTTITNKEDNSKGYLDYVWVDSKLVSISFTSDELNQTVKYLYNDFGEPVGFIATREDGSVDTFYYLKNAQGDITHIVSAAGKKMVSFTYDDFGKRTVEYQASNSTTPGQIELLTQMKADLLNPFAYRGYCFDYDMGMYYLQSRYYDPEVGRFINADSTDYLDATGTALGCNLFAYCENDPVNFVDHSGTLSVKSVKSFFQSLGSKAWKLAKNLISEFVWKPGYLGLKLFEILIDTCLNFLPFAKAFKFVSYKAVTKQLVAAGFRNAKKGLQTFLSKLAFSISFNTLFANVVNNIFFKYTSRLLTAGGLICLAIDFVDGKVDYWFNYGKFQ